MLAQKSSIQVGHVGGVVSLARGTAEPFDGVAEILAEPVKAPLDKAALTITFPSWSTPVVGLVMLLIGLVGGFFVRPFLSPSDGAGSQPETEQSSPPNTQAQASPEDRAALMEAVLPGVRHFLGDENAPITLIEFSDFQ